MKFLLILMLAIYSFSLFASVKLTIELDVADKKTTINQNIELDKSYSEKLIDGKMEYILSAKRPSDYSADYLWDEKSIHLKVRIYDSKGKVISSPEVTTVLGKTATVEQFNSTNATSPSLKIGFTANNL